MPIPFEFELSDELWLRFRSSYYIHVLRRSCLVDDRKMRTFYHRHWLSGANALSLREIDEGVLHQIGEAFPGRHIQFYACANIVIAFVGRSAVAVFSRDIDGSVAVIYVDRDAVHRLPRQEVVSSADARRRRHGAYAPDGEFARQLNTTCCPGGFSVR